mmetsp:Transcript_28230/g.74053  ORF Transcript_28230/g.74053 Transcript_28230/m.74053 type:complete len:215 (-) Transcript_28230:86-730(-)
MHEVEPWHRHLRPAHENIPANIFFSFSAYAAFLVLTCFCSLRASLWVGSSLSTAVTSASHFTRPFGIFQYALARLARALMLSGCSASTSESREMARSCLPLFIKMDAMLLSRPQWSSITSACNRSGTCSPIPSSIPPRPAGRPPIASPSAGAASAAPPGAAAAAPPLLPAPFGRMASVDIMAYANFCCALPYSPSLKKATPSAFIFAASATALS